MDAQPGGFADTMGSLHRTLLSQTGLGSGQADALWGATRSKDDELKAARDRVENSQEVQIGKFVHRVCLCVAMHPIGPSTSGDGVLWLRAPGTVQPGQQQLVGEDGEPHAAQAVWWLALAPASGVGLATIR